MLDLRTIHDRSVGSIGLERVFSSRRHTLEMRAEHEKDRLANLMAYGVDLDKLPAKKVERVSTPPREIDRFDERNEQRPVANAHRSHRFDFASVDGNRRT
jgi:hypothetical protein